MYIVYVKIRRHQHTRVHTRTQARGAMPELRRVTDTTSHTACPEAGVCSNRIIYPRPGLLVRAPRALPPVLAFALPFPFPVTLARSLQLWSGRAYATRRSGSTCCRETFYISIPCSLGFPAS